MFNVVLYTPDVVGDRMAGPGIRAWHLSRELGRHFPTTLVAKHEGIVPEEVPTIASGTDAARAAMRDATVLIGQPSRGFGRRKRQQKLVFDLFDPTVLELRELYGNLPSPRQRIHLAAEWWRLAMALMGADLFVSASKRQQHFYGALQSGDAPWVEVPFGLDLDEAMPPADAESNLVLWGGGLWEWLDPVSAVDAVVRLNAEGLPARLLFLGRSRPNRDLVDRRRDDRFDVLLARGGRFIAANEEWVPYRQRLSWLRKSKIAIMLHRRTAEAEYSIRTRLFDAIAAGTPVVASAGGFAADLVERERLGIVVPPGDTDAVTRAIRKLLTDDEMHASCVKNLERIRPQYAWQVVTRPLVDAIMKWQT